SPRALDLSDSRNSDKGAAALAASPTPARPAPLRPSRAGAGREGAQALRGSASRLLRWERSRPPCGLLVRPRPSAGRASGGGGKRLALALAAGGTAAPCARRPGATRAV